MIQDFAMACVAVRAKVRDAAATACFAVLCKPLATGFIYYTELLVIPCHIVVPCGTSDFENNV